MSPRGFATLLALAAVTSPESGRADPAEDARRALAQFRREPSVRAVQRAALRAARLDAGESDGWRSRVNAAHVLPELRLRAFHALDRDESVELEPGSPDRWDVDAGEGWTFEARAQWDLSLLVWDPDEIDIGREALHRAEARNELLERVARLYFERRRRQVALRLRPPSDAVAIAEARIGIDELTAALDGLTGGWYGAELR